MVIAPLHYEMLRNRLGQIQQFRRELEELANLDRDEFLSDSRNPAATESFLRRALEAVFDIGRHILAKRQGKAVAEYKEIARALGEGGVVSKELSETIVLMAGYRNRMVHMYYEVNDEELYELIRKHRTDLDRFVREITLFMNKVRHEPPGRPKRSA